MGLFFLQFFYCILVILTKPRLFSLLVICFRHSPAPSFKKGGKRYCFVKFHVVCLLVNFCIWHYWKSSTCKKLKKKKIGLLEPLLELIKLNLKRPRNQTKKTFPPPLYQKFVQRRAPTQEKCATNKTILSPDLDFVHV